MKLTRIAALAAAGAAAIALGWRLASNRYHIPCPAWLSVLLENPFIDTIAGSTKVLERARLRPGMKVLDAGCGPGRLTVPAARLVGPEGTVVAIDLQPAMLRRLHEKLAAEGIENVRTLRAALGKGALQEDGFDRALLVTVLGEIPNREEALREIHGALISGGILSVTEVLPDPHFQSQGAVQGLGEKVGFELHSVYGIPLAFTMNLLKPPRAR